MKTNVRKPKSPHPSALCLAIMIALIVPALVLPGTASAQDAALQDQPEATASQQAEDADEDAATEEGADEGELFSLEDSDDPERLKDLIEIRNSIEAGVFHVSDDAFRFGRYTGMNDRGFGAILNLDFTHRAPWDGDNAGFWSFKTHDLGLDARDASFEFGVQGKYRVHVDYDQIPNFRSESTRTIFQDAGSDDLTLPSGWVGSGTTAGMTQLLPSLRPFELKTERRQAGIGVSGVLARHWNFKVDYRQEQRDGNRSIGAVFGNSGGNPRAVLIPEPVDYTTQQIDAAMSYATKAYQIEVAYYASLFSNQNDSLTWSNPYTTIAGWAAGTGFPTARGQLALSPDNQFHQLSLNAGYNVSDRTRLSASASRGRMTQDEAFLPYTNIPSLQASVTQPLPRDSLEGRIDTTVVNLRLASRPTDNFAWNASYRYDDRDNRTPQDEFIYIGGDSQTQQTAANSNRRRRNLPYSFTEQQFKVDATYRAFGHTDFSAGAQRSNIDRTYSEREQTDETTFNLGLNTEVSEKFNGYVRLSRAERDGSTYYGTVPFNSSYAPAFVATAPGGWENHPDLRRSFLANRIRTQTSAGLSYMPAEAWTFGITIERAKDAYNESKLGLTSSRIQNYIFDATYAPSPLSSAYAFFSHEKLLSEQNGHSFGGGANQLPQSADPNRAWFVDHSDSIGSFGIGYKRSAASGRIDFGIDYLHSKSRSELNFATGSALVSRALPSDQTRLDSVNVNATYKLRENLSLRFGAWYERYRSRDWSVDGIAPNTLANVILLGEDSPDYNVYVFSFSAIYRF